MKNVEKFLRAIGDDKRLRILKMLEKKDLCVCEITAVLGIRQPTVSRHLKRLEEAGLIQERQKSFYTEYYVSKSHPFCIIWKLLSGKLEKSVEAQSDLCKLKQIDRYKLCGSNGRGVYEKKR